MQPGEESLIHMRSLFTFAFILGLTTNSFATPTDTVEYWTVTINGKPLSNSSVTAIMYGHPMKIELSAFNENDTLQSIIGQTMVQSDKSGITS
jgi:hypothetical protein